MEPADYDRLLAALERAIAVLEARPVRLGFDEEVYGRLKDIRDRVGNARGGTGTPRDSKKGRLARRPL